MPRQSNTLRIIGGNHRGRKLSFVDAKGLRPTPDRMRETLFNWLQPVIHGARCLDLFAGSGALGLEALSRGAASVEFVERDGKAAKRLGENLQLLGYDAKLCHAQTAQSYLDAKPEPFDVVFLDPPYQGGLLQQVIEQLDKGWLNKGARIYMEHDSHHSRPDLPPGWTVLKARKAGQVTALLLQVEAA